MLAAPRVVPAAPAPSVVPISPAPTPSTETTEKTPPEYVPIKLAKTSLNIKEILTKKGTMLDILDNLGRNIFSLEEKIRTSGSSSDTLKKELDECKKIQNDLSELINTEYQPVMDGLVKMNTKFVEAAKAAEEAAKAAKAAEEAAKTANVETIKTARKYNKYKSKYLNLKNQ